MLGIPFSATTRTPLRILTASHVPGDAQATLKRSTVNLHPEVLPVLLINRLEDQSGEWRQYRRDERKAAHNQRQETQYHAGAETFREHWDENTSEIINNTAAMSPKQLMGRWVRDRWTIVHNIFKPSK